MTPPSTAPLPEGVAVAVVTGGGSGIGRATAIHFARNNHVAVIDIDQGLAEKTVGEIEAAGGVAMAMKADVTSESAFAAAIDDVLERWGRLDYASNTVGVTGPPGLGVDYALDDWNRVVAVNLTSVFICMKHEIRAMQRGSGGAIVNCASAAAMIGVPGLPAYSATKAAVVGLTRAWALDYVRQRIRINSVCPGSVDTPMIRGLRGDDQAIVDRIGERQPIGRVAQPEEIANAIVWLCSPESSYVVGHAFSVDGGTVISYR